LRHPDILHCQSRLQNATDRAFKKEL